jgi:hypothetical protein
MSVIFVVAPVVAGSWPIVSAAIIAASAALGYTASARIENNLDALNSISVANAVRSIEMRMSDSQVVTDTLQRGESFTVEREGVTAVFRVDGRGQCQVHLSGVGVNEMALQSAGQELMDKVRQQFAYAQVMAELETRGFEVVHQEMEADQSIRIRVKR